MAIQIIKVEDLDVSKLSFVYKVQKEEDAKAKFFWMNYNGAPVYIQFPKSTPLFKGANDYKANKQFSVNIDLAHTPEILEKMKKIDEKCQAFAKESLKDLKISKKTYNMLVKPRNINEEPIESVSVYDKESETWTNPMLAFKIDFERGTFVHDKKVIQVDDSNVRTYLGRDNQFLTVVNYYGYVASGSYGLTGKMIKTKIWGDKSGGGLHFVDESDAESNAQDTQDSDGDTKMENVDDNSEEEIVITDDEAQ